MHHLTYAEAAVVGLFQGVTELFPVSSLGHSILIPALVGGSWARDLNITAPNSPYLAFIVGMHVATAIAMIVFFWRDWVRIVGGFFTSLRYRRIETVYQRMAWMIILGTIPVGIVGALLQHAVQKTFAKPVVTAVFLAVNGLILFGGERLRRREVAAAGVVDEDYVDEGYEDEAYADARYSRPDRERGGYGPRGQGAPQGASRQAAPARDPRWRNPALDETRVDMPVIDETRMDMPAIDETRIDGSLRGGSRAGGRGPGYHDDRQRAGSRRPPAPRGQQAVHDQDADEDMAADRRLVRLGYGRAIFLGSLQILALLPGISRDGIVMIGGMFRGLPRQDAARFSFLLSAPVIFAAGALKLPDLMGPDGNGIRGQVLAGSILSGIGAYLALRYLTRYLSDHSRTLTPFAIYCLVVGLGSAIYLH